jgi:hypothetical protein
MDSKSFEEFSASNAEAIRGLIRDKASLTKTAKALIIDRQESNARSAPPVVDCPV